jgi:beta-lactam-binding protein with PASTA domain
MLRLGQQNLKPAGLTYVPTEAKGILAADPPIGTVVGPQTPVSLLVSVPPPAPQFVMPDLIDRPLDEVRRALESRGLNVSTVKYETYPGIADGIIIRQYPLRGAPVSSRDGISVVVSRQGEAHIVDQTPGM